MPTWSKAVPDMTSPAASGRHLSKFEKRPTAVFAVSRTQCQRRLQISRVKNIGNVSELSAVAVRFGPTLWWVYCINSNEVLKLVSTHWCGSSSAESIWRKSVKSSWHSTRNSCLLLMINEKCKPIVQMFFVAFFCFFRRGSVQQQHLL